MTQTSKIKGCGRTKKRWNCDYEATWVCGEKKNGELWLCDICKAQLLTRKTDIIEFIDFLENCFLDKKLIFTIDRIAERLDGDELVLLHKLIEMANKQNKDAQQKLAELKSELQEIK